MSYQIITDTCCDFPADMYKELPADETGQLHKGRARHPIVEDDVVIYAGATILGRITIGQGSTIGGQIATSPRVENYPGIMQISGMEFSDRGDYVPL